MSLLSKKALSIAAAIFIAGCSNSETGSITGTDMSSDEVRQECIKKDGKSRSAYSWERIAAIPNARDIAAFDDVYVISADGATIYKGGAGGFSPITTDAYIFQKDPAVTIAAGAPSTRSTSPTQCEGVYVTTESKKVYRLTSGGWERVGTTNADGVGVTTGTPEYHRDDCYIFTDNGSNDIVSYTRFSENSWTTTRKSINKDIIAVDYGTFLQTSSHSAVTNVLFLCSDNTLNTIDFFAQEFIEYYTPDIIPSKDVASSPTGGLKFATFHNNSNQVYYYNGATSVNLGYARKISISKDNYLWDAYGNAIYRKRIQ